jgi:hypothetical protein
MTEQNLPTFRYNGARSLVMLHANHMRSFLDTWKEAKARNISLPETDDRDYQSLDTLLRHVFRASRGYMTWLCENLELPDPEIRPVPEADRIAETPDTYLLHLLEGWQFPLRDIEEERFHQPTYTSRWGVEYCIDAMLEHAVMHPIRHEFQLRRIMDQKPD